MLESTIELVKEAFGTKWREDYENYIGTYVLTEWRYGKREEVLEAASDMKKIKDGQKTRTESEIKFSRYRTTTLLQCIKSAPFTVSMKAIKDLPVGIADFFHEIVDELNEDGISAEELKKFFET